jgi:hypothetical protein
VSSIQRKAFLPGSGLHNYYPGMGTQLFFLGIIVATSEALELVRGSSANPAELLERHPSGDLGEVLPEDTREKEYSLKHGFGIVSS